MKKLLLAALIAAAMPIVANAASLQRYQSGFRTIDGNQLNLMVDVVNGLTGNGTAQPGTFTTLTSGVHTITSASANALTVGRLGATTPALQIDASTATSITGIKIKSAATGGGVALSAIGEASNGNMTIDAQGSGTLTLNATATGNIVLSRATTTTSSLAAAGPLTANSGTAVPNSAGAVATGAPIAMFNGGNKIWITSDAPSFSATKGDLCINTGGSSTSTRLFINNGTTNWIAITTAS